MIRCSKCGTGISEEESMCNGDMCEGCWQDDAEQDDDDE